MRVAIRIDDITPDMDWAKFLRFKEILDKHGVKPLIGVVPDNKDKKLKIDLPRKDFWNYVKELRKDGWTIAMHGVNHLYTTKKAGNFPIGNKSEFAGLSLEDQDYLIREGRRIFRANDIPTDIFMAPSHSFDYNTLKALKKNGFDKITDGFGSGPYEKDGMTFYPISISKSKSLADKSEGLVTFVYHTNTMDDSDFENFEKLFDKAEVVSYSEYKKMDVSPRTLTGDIKEYALAKGKFTLMQVRKKIKK
ncbi:DUF2334 domain-containing protein [Butyrivibrio sp. MC2021]|uniref:DUF2334 domain-containing protein n=1 Tax=Butyrivibrio sp. MC2021 TaxID=1408306 RepID=UPI000479D27E|nr:DUF2334 domain-containing protein [Butyrivibrio sp. MC2021]